MPSSSNHLSPVQAAQPLRRRGDRVRPQRSGWAGGSLVDALRPTPAPDGAGL